MKNWFYILNYPFIFTMAVFAVITYANIAQVKYPFTADSTAITDIIDRLKIIIPDYAQSSTF